MLINGNGSVEWVDINGIENPNNYVSLKSHDFVKIISGENIGYNQPGGGNARAMYSDEYQKSKKLGLEPNYFAIQLPHELWNRGLAYRERAYITTPIDQRPDFNKPLVHKIEGAVFWFRGINYGSQELLPDLVQPIKLADCQFEYSFRVSQVQSSNTLSLSNCQFQAPNENENTQFSFNHTSFKKVYLNRISAWKSNSRVSVDCVSFEDNNINSLVIDDCLIKELDIFTDKGNIDELIITNSTIGRIRIKGDNIKKCYLRGLVKCGAIDISGKFEELIIEHDEQTLVLSDQLFAENLNIELSSRSKGVVILKNIRVSSLKLEKESDKNVVIKDVKLDSLFISNFINLATLRFRSIYCSTLLEIENSTLGKTELSNIVFAPRSKARIFQSNIEEISIHNTRFPTKILSKDEKDIEGTREAYRQLKYASAKYGNRFAELNYQRLEMDTHFKSLNYKTHFGDKLILLLSKVSSSYGQNWLQALGSTATFGLITYTIYCWSLGFGIGSDWSLFWKLSSYFLEYLNPLHKADFITDDLDVKRTGWSIAWDNLSRVINGFFVYQMIQAFRKFGKS